jgi:hypothetical protein
LLERSLFREEIGQGPLESVALTVAILSILVIVAYFIKNMAASTVGPGIEEGKESVARVQGSGQ